MFLNYFLELKSSKRKFIIDNKGILDSLPSIPNNKQGWPWSVEVTPSIYENAKYLPKISIITPSYNQGRFIEETIRSVILQNYPLLEYIIIDGGSTDNTLDILKKYDAWIDYWVSEKDSGQASAINKGIKLASGEYIGWQNSDDIYLEKAFYHLQKTIVKNNKSGDVFFGNIIGIDVHNNRLHKRFFIPFSFYELKYYGMNIANQGTFFKRSIISENLLDEKIHFALEEYIYFKLAEKRVAFVRINAFIGAFRYHNNSKTNIIGRIGLIESIKIRNDYKIPQKDKNWRWQFIFQKNIAWLRKLFYYIIQGDLIEYLKHRAKRKN
ncbi:MAG: glycosyltransferase family 2 protein [Bacteroidota bacterium]